MRWPIRNQILLPFAIVQSIAVAGLSVSAAMMAAQRAEREAVEQLDRVVATLSTASFPVQGSVLDQMKGLSGADFVASDLNGKATASTLTPEQTTQILAAPVASAGAGRLGSMEPISIGSETWRVGAVNVLRSPTLKQLLVLLPERQWETARREVVLPPLMIGAATLLLMVTVSFWLSARMGRRLKHMQMQVQKLASLEFHELLSETGHDELQELAASINRMARDLQASTHRIRMNERASLVTQVAGGLAHQLRNSITGARMAVQLHLRRCGDADRESLNVALRQLSLTENQIRGLLRLTRDAHQPPVSGRMDDIVRTICELLHPQCQHAEICLTIELPTGCEAEKLVLTDADPVQASVLNLVQNAVEACGPGGSVHVAVSLENAAPDEMTSGKLNNLQDNQVATEWIRVDVFDTGPGVDSKLGERIFEPFVTGKPEGVGLGLALAVQTAEDHGGTLKFSREQQMTRFCFRIPVQRFGR